MQIRFLRPLILGIACVLNVSAEVTFTTTSTSAQVNSIAGSENDIGVQQPPSSIQVIRNNAFADVPQNDQGDGRGSAGAEVQVSLSEQATENVIFGSMQVTASILPADGEAFSSASVTVFLNRAGKVFVEPSIRQGNIRIFIDSDEKSTSTREFSLDPGQHKLEITAQTTFSTVTNPNYSVSFEFVEEAADDGGAGIDPPTTEDPIFQEITKLKDLIRKLKFPKTTRQIAVTNKQLTRIRKAEGAIRSELQTRPVSTKVSKLVEATRRATVGLGKSLPKGKSKFLGAKKRAISSLEKLELSLQAGA